jgi:hypothetical protein
VIASALSRAVAIALATLVMFGLVFLREATSPSGEGYWTAMAAARGGNLYLADEAHRELRLINRAGTSERLAAVPPGIFRALAADGPNLLLATEGGLYQTNDTGAHWRKVLSGRFTAVDVFGAYEVAGAWADGLFTSDDSGASWSRAEVPAGDTEFEAVLAKPMYAATLLGLLRSDDGTAWTRVPGVPDRITTIAYEGAFQILRAGDWRGTVWNYDLAGATVVRSAGYPGGVESLAGSVVATTGGVYPDRPGPLHGREVTRVVESGDVYYASAAGGAVYLSGDGVNWTFAYQG